MKRIPAVIGALFALSLHAAAQDAPFGERVDVRLVQVDAVVTDARGNQILGLDKDDFVVRENGVDQKIDSVEYYTNRTSLDARDGKAPYKAEKTVEERNFVFFFDKPSDGALWNEIARARSAVRTFIAGMRPGDRVAIAGHDSRLKIYSDFSDDRETLFRALDDAGQYGPGLRSGSGPILKAMMEPLMMNGTGTVYEALEVLGDALRTTRGRKNLILFSAGIYEPGQNDIGGGLLTESRFYRPMIQSLNASNVTVYAMNIIRTPQSLPLFHQVLQALTNDTDGQYFRHSVGFEGVLRKIEQTTNGYYLISYYSSHARANRGFQKVDVALRNPSGLRLQARGGYVRE